MDNLDNATIKKVLIGVSAGLVAIAGIYYMTRPIETRETVYDPPKEGQKLKPAKKQPVSAGPPGQAPQRPQMTRAQTTVKKPEPKLDMAENKLTKESLLKVFDTIRIKLTAEYQEIHDSFISKRRANRGNKDEYAKCAQEWQFSQTNLSDKICSVVFKEFEVTEQ